MLRAAVATLVVLVAGCGSPPMPVEESVGNPFLGPGETIVFQVDTVKGYDFEPAALAGLVEQVRATQNGAIVHQAGGLEPMPDVVTAADVVARHRATYSGNGDWRDEQGRPVLQVLGVNGEWAHEPPGRTVFGVAMTHTNVPVIVIFLDQLPTLSLYRASVAVPGLSPEGYQRAVLVHEFGHMLGLVNCGAPDTADRFLEGCHADSPRSVMHHLIHASEDPLVWALDDEMQPVWRFDEDDLADIRAAQAAA